jgi:hypothetical protein
LHAVIECSPQDLNTGPARGSYPWVRSCKTQMSCGQRIIRPYSLWMLQRARDTYRGIPTSHRERVDGMLRSVGGQDFIGFIDPPRLAREGLSVRAA